MRNARVELIDVALKGCDNASLLIQYLTSETILVATRCEFANSNCGVFVEGCTDIAAGDGLISKDYAILVEAVDTTICQSSVDGDGNQMTLGYAAPCKYDQYDRPILGSAKKRVCET